MESIDLPRYVSLLKNLRAVAFLDPNAPIPVEEIKWLKRKYKYRNIGISESLIKALKAESRDFFLKKPFEILKSPLLEIKKFVEVLSNVSHEAPEYVIESLVLASCYVNALIILRRDSFSILEPFAAWVMKSTAELPETEIKRNLRIVGYAILDFHDEVIGQAYKTLKKVVGEPEKAREELHELIEERRKVAEKDGEKRFWRLRKTGGEKERIVIAYLDLMPLILRILSQDKPKELINFIDKSTRNISMALSLIPTFILQLK